MKKYPLPNSEHGIQVGFFNWVRRNRKHSRNEGVRNALNLCYAVPNGLSTNQSQRAKMEGLTAGIPDISLDCRQSVYHTIKYVGLRIEMKYGKNTLSEVQQKKRTLLVEAGYKYEVCKSTQEAIEAVMNYLPYPREDYIEPEY